jgi:hypothetical protein
MLGKRLASFIALTLATLLISALGLDVGRASAPSWKEYKNSRFGFSLDYPAELEASPPPADGAGREFHTANKEFSLSAQGFFYDSTLSQSFDGFWQKELQEYNGHISYQRKTANWYVISGTLENGYEYYKKRFSKGGNWVLIEMTYPNSLRAKYDPWVEAIIKTVQPFLPGGDYDRVP